MHFLFNRIGLIMYTWFPVRCKSYTWAEYNLLVDAAYKDAQEKGLLSTSKYTIIRDAKKDTTNDFIFVACHWDPKKGTSYWTTFGVDQVWQNGKRL